MAFVQQYAIAPASFGLPWSIHPDPAAAVALSPIGQSRRMWAYRHVVCGRFPGPGDGPDFDPLHDEESAWLQQLPNVPHPATDRREGGNVAGNPCFLSSS